MSAIRRVGFWFRHRGLASRFIICVIGVAIAPLVLGITTMVINLVAYTVLVIFDPWGIYAGILAIMAVIAVESTPTGREHRARRRLRWRLRRWPDIARACGLMQDGVCPGLRVTSVARDASRWEGLLGIPAGMTPGMIGRQSEPLSHALGASSVRVLPVVPGTARIVVDMQPRLITPVRPGPLGCRVDLEAVPIGQTVDGDSWMLRVRGSHTLIAGASGSGKGSVLWSSLWAMSSEIDSGMVQVWAIDGKGGVELRAGAGLFSRFATMTDEAEALLSDAVNAMSRRAEAMAGTTRLHVPTSASPHVVILIDELAAITSYIPDAKLRRSIIGFLSRLLSQGRALGFTVIACTQHPSKEILPMRDLFIQRIALRLTEKPEARMVLGDAAVDTGADPVQIPKSQPGVAYAVGEAGEPVMARASWISDDQIAHLAAAVHARSTITDLSLAEEN